MDTIILNNDDILQLSEFCIFHVLLHLKSDTPSNVKKTMPQALGCLEVIVFVSNNSGNIQMLEF